VYAIEQVTWTFFVVRVVVAVDVKRISVSVEVLVFERIAVVVACVVVAEEVAESGLDVATFCKTAAESVLVAAVDEASKKIAVDDAVSLVLDAISSAMATVVPKRVPRTTLITIT
jgi:hypothetical protein